MLRIGDKFKLTDDAIENYGEEYKGKSFTVESVSTSVEEHRGYDDSMEGMALYDADELDFSVYEYEVEEVESIVEMQVQHQRMAVNYAVCFLRDEVADIKNTLHKYDLTPVVSTNLEKRLKELEADLKVMEEWNDKYSI